MKTEIFRVHSGFDGTKCHVHARMGITAGGEYVLTAQKLLLAGSDLFDGLEETHSTDLLNWTPFRLNPGLVPVPIEEGSKVELSVCDYSPNLHEATGKLLGTGAEICYDTTTMPKKKYIPHHKNTAYTVYNEEIGRFDHWKVLEVPDDYFKNTRAGSTQRYDEADGTILLPVYGDVPEFEKAMISVVFRCSFDGETLKVIDIGNAMVGETDTRGLCEPSVSKFPKNGKYVMSMRSDKSSWFAVSDDGLHYCEADHWRFDDGEILGQYNTQAHFARLGDKLYLVYTRKGANNDHVFRHRAPLFIGEIDPKTCRIIRETERAIVPERGARLGNFGVTRVSDNECIVTAAEWMQPVGCEKYGSDNTIYAVRLTAE